MTQITIDVKDGVGTATGYANVSNMGLNLRGSVRGGAVVMVFDNSSELSGTAEGESPATVEVEINRTNGTYSINPGYRPFAPGKGRSVSCARDTCREQELPAYVESCLPAGGRLLGPLTEPNHLHGSMNDTKTGLGRSRNGTQTWTVNWDLARQGTSQ